MIPTLASNCDKSNFAGPDPIMQTEVVFWIVIGTF
jgi:hypothetical protein